MLQFVNQGCTLIFISDRYTKSNLWCHVWSKLSMYWDEFYPVVTDYEVTVYN